MDARRGHGGVVRRRALLRRHPRRRRRAPTPGAPPLVRRSASFPPPPRPERPPPRVALGRRGRARARRGRVRVRGERAPRPDGPAPSRPSLGRRVRPRPPRGGARARRRLLPHGRVQAHGRRPPPRLPRRVHRRAAVPGQVPHRGDERAEPVLPHEPRVRRRGGRANRRRSRACTRTRWDSPAKKPRTSPRERYGGSSRSGPKSSTPSSCAWREGTRARTPGGGALFEKVFVITRITNAEKKETLEN